MGWCSSHSIPLRVPPDLSALLEEEETKLEAIKAVEEAQKDGVSVPEESLDVDGYTAVDRIKCGMKVEVSVTKPFFPLYRQTSLNYHLFSEFHYYKYFKLLPFCHLTT